MAVVESTRTVSEILDRVLAGERLADADALTLMQSKDLVSIGAAANEIRNRKANPGEVTYIVDRNINYSNICVTDCNFCAFYRQPGDTREGYVLPKRVIFAKIEETIAVGGTGCLMQGGHNPDLTIEWYEDLFRSIKERYPTFHLHALSPPEVTYISRRAHLTIAETISRLRDAGLDSIPGGGGEILVQRVRDCVAKKKAGADRWLEVMEIAHQEGLKTSCTMMYGIGETLEERVEHLLRLKALQDRTKGFTAFICWPLQPENTPELSHMPKTDAVEYLRTTAFARTVLDTIPNIQASWVTMGMKVGQMALHYGCNDFGSLMLEENVVSAANTTHRTTIDEIEGLIRQAGFMPRRRKQNYQLIEAAA